MGRRRNASRRKKRAAKAVMNTPHQKYVIWSVSEDNEPMILCRDEEDKAELQKVEFTKEIKAICWDTKEEAQAAVLRLIPHLKDTVEIRLLEKEDDPLDDEKKETTAEVEENDEDGEVCIDEFCDSRDSSTVGIDEDDPFADNNDLFELFRDLSDRDCIPTEAQLMKIVATFYPSWIRANLSGFVEECSPIDAQWTHMTKVLKTDKARILLVDQTFINQRTRAIRDKIEITRYRCIMKLCDWFSARGYFVRDKISFEKCKACHRCMMPPSYYGSMGFPANGKCMKCNRRDPAKVRGPIASIMQTRSMSDNK